MKFIFIEIQSIYELLDKEFSEDDDYTQNNRLNYERLTNYKQNGYRYHTDDDDSEDEEEITIIRRVTNIFRTTINNTSRILDSITPNTIKRAANRCPTLWPFLLLLVFSVPLVYVMSHYKSSLWSDSSLEALTTGDVSSKHAINQLVKEIKELKFDLKNLKDSNHQNEHRMRDNELNSNAKLNHLNNKIDSIEDYLNNIMKNCCRNETDKMLALIDWRLSTFMAQMLDQTREQSSVTPSEAAQQLKQFIRLELSKTNNDFKESIEQKLMATIERIQNEMPGKKSDHLSSNITIDEIKSLISEALAIYDADKTGQPDFALEPAGI